MTYCEGSLCNNVMKLGRLNSLFNFYINSINKKKQSALLHKASQNLNQFCSNASRELQDLQSKTIAIERKKCTPNCMHLIIKEIINRKGPYDIDIFVKKNMRKF